MSAITTDKTFLLSPHNLHSLLEAMLMYGEPRIGYNKIGKPGWYCRIQMNTTSAGTSFDVSSEFSLDTPISAACQCWERIQLALGKQHANP